MDFSTLYYAALMVFGIGLLIFVHELGHYLVAKWADVKVEAFSLGFGPAIISRTVGETTYMLCVIPLGGYVKMAGEPGMDDGTGDARDFSSKSVGARAAIILAGPVMNLVFALIAFPIIFSLGIDMDAPVLGHVTEGKPAWVARLERGDRILRLNGNTVYSFEDIRFEIALADGPVKVDFVRNGEERSTLVEPEYVAAYGFQAIGVGPTTEPGLEVEAKKGFEVAGLDGKYPLVSFNGVSAEELQADMGAFREIQRQMTDVPFVVKRGGAPTTIMLPKRVETLDENRFLGIRFIPSGTVEATKRDSALPLSAGDRVLKVNGQFVFGEESIRQAVLKAPPGAVRLTLNRVKDAGSDPVEIEVPALADVATRAATLDDVMFKVGNLVEPVPGYAAERAGIRAGDQIVAVDGDPTKSSEDIQKKIRAYDEAERPKGLEFKVRRARVEEGRLTHDEVTIYAAPMPDRVNRAFAALTIVSNRLTDEVKFPLPESITKGIRHSGIWAYNIFNTLKSLFSGRVSPKTLSGILMIGHVTYNRAKEGWMRLFYFLAILSVNLAIVNLLPIPTLDGGHLLFLLVEKIKGSPVSERIQVLGLKFGLLLILALIVFVTYNDIKRIFG